MLTPEEKKKINQLRVSALHTNLYSLGEGKEIMERIAENLKTQGFSEEFCEEAKKAIAEMYPEEK